tara:strand:- start:167 stop:1774 length:1608 start_codon:yes stop_codon:yes gene_type:complete
MFIGGYVRFISKILMAGFLFSVIVPISASAFTGGMLSGDRTLVLSESPYQITSPIEIPYGTKLTVEPGVEITSETGEPLFFVNGAVEILGSASQPVRIVSTGPVFYPKNATDASIKVSFASIDGGGSGSLVGASGYSQTATYEFSDSDFFNLGTYSYIWYPNSFLAERNVFTNSAGFSIGFDARSSAQGASAPVFRNNLFLGAPKKTYGESYWVKGWASYGSTLQMVGNTFAGGIYEAVRTASSYDKIPLNAQANFWGTEIASEIEAMVVDSRDGLSYGTVIDISNFLSSPSPQSPTGRRFQLAISPAPTATSPAPTPVGPETEVELGVPSIIYSWEGTRLNFVVSGLPSTQNFRVMWKAGGKWRRVDASRATGEFRVSKYSGPKAPISFQVSFYVAGAPYFFKPIGVEGQVGEASDLGNAPSPSVAHLEGHGPDDGEFSVWTKVLEGGNQLKFYAKYLQPGQKVQFMVQNSNGVYEQVAWKRVDEADLGPAGAYTDMQNYVYFIRTIDLGPGKNRVRILVDGELVWGTKTYTVK